MTESRFLQAAFPFDFILLNMEKEQRFIHEEGKRDSNNKSSKSDAALSEGNRLQEDADY